MNILSLFAGVGGLELGLERAGMTVVGQVELDPFCRRVLAKHWPDVPKHDDVRTAADWWLSEERPPVDLICGGFPCQDISVAGRREGITGARSGLWAFMRDTVRAVRPRYVVVENVPGILVRGLDVVAADLAEIGYDAEWDCIPAAAVGASHGRDRWFGVAYANGIGRVGRPRIVGQTGRPEPANCGGEGTAGHGLSDSGGGRHRVSPRVLRAGRDGFVDGDWWTVEPDVGRVAYGVPGRVDRVRALGNAVVPQVAEHVGRLIVAADSEAAA